MSDAPSDKDFPSFASTRSQKAKEKDTKKPTVHGPSADANTNVSEPHLDMSLILSEIKANGSRLDRITSHLEGIANSVSCLQNSFTALSERVTGAESRLEETERRISSAEDSATATEKQVANLKMMVDQLQSKVDDLENRGRRKNLKIVGLPEKAEGSGPLSSYLQDMIPKWLDLPVNFAVLDIERAHRSPNFASSNPNSAPRSSLVRFLRFTDKEAILKAAMKKTITHNGSELRFYSDLSAGLLQKRREFGAVGKAFAARGLYRRFAYPARLRCLHNGKIRLFNDPDSAKAFLDSLDS
ncbi:hypothetical protein QQF64_029872 [Cirrhinus molitorella]|uniref:L1 transposable element RRM domain-containing protein n=1 Tax=Cirrhinus molitorella TaxID=172907 RepID=A0ABR3N212_9TELE